MAKLSPEMVKLDNEVKDFVKDIGIPICKRAGLGAMAKAFYLGLNPTQEVSCDISEVANELELSIQEINYWEDLWYKKDSWLNN